MLADTMRTGVTEIHKEAAVRRGVFSLFAKAIGKGDAKAIQGLLKQHGKNLSNIEKQTLSKMQFKDSKGVSSIFDFTSGKFAPVKPPAVQPQVNWTDKWTQQYDKDPLKTLALTGGGVYAGSRVLENVFGNKLAAADLEYIMKFKQHRGIL